MKVIPKFVKVEENDEEIKLFSLLNETTILVRGPKNRESLHKLLNKEETDNEELKEALIDNHMLMDAEMFQEFANSRIKEWERALTITIMPTQNCNFRCIYCYEDHIPNRISDETIEGIIKFIDSELQKDDMDGVSIPWFGGEPLLCKDIVIDMSRRIREIATKYGKFANFSITTNGYLLDIETFKELIEVGVNDFQITLDGFEHDSKRVLVGGGPTSEVILNNLEEIRKLDPDKYWCEILLRRNILPDESFEYYDFIGKKFGNDPRFILLIRKVFSNPQMDPDQLIKDNDYYEAHKEYARKWFKLYDDRNDMYFGSGMCNFGGKHSFLVLPDGSVQKCTTTHFDEDFSIIGKVTPDGFEIDDEKHKIWYELPKITEKCMECKELFTCLNNSCPKIRALGRGRHCCGEE